MTFDDRIDYNGDLQKVVDRICDVYDIALSRKYSVIKVGFEDFNLKIETLDGNYLAKIFSKKRDHADILRYSTTLSEVAGSKVNHPKIYKTKDSQLLYTDHVSGLKLVLMEFVEGKSFYDLKRLPSNDELEQICREAVKIHAINYSPDFVFDSWAIPNMKWMYDKVKNDLSSEGIQLVDRAFAYYESIPFDDLPKCFVHGDLTKANTLLGNDGKLYVIDFAVSNTYPRIQELAVMAANLLFDENNGASLSLKDRCGRVKDIYEKCGGVLSDLEKLHLFNYALPAAAMEYMGSVNERIVGDNSDEIAYWEKLGLDGLREALAD